MPPHQPSAPWDDPYRPPTPPAKSQPAAPFKAKSAPGRLEFGRMWTFAWESTQWALNLLCGAVVSFVPFLGPLVLYGYQLEIVEALHRDPQRVYPDFDFSRFADYLVRGVWVFLAMLAIGLVLAPVMILLIGGVVVATAVAAGIEEDAAPGVFALGTALFVATALLIALPAALIAIPLTIRAGLAQDFSNAFHWGWIKRFISLMWREMIAGSLFLMLTAPIVMMLGTLLCYVGVFPAATLAALAQANLLSQLYELFLQRGGELVPLKDPEQHGW